MARLASNEKMGYYPTPKTSLEHIKALISADKYYGSHALDPCCGTGEALWDAASAMHTYGIELDVERADAASTRLDKVLQGSIFDVMVKPPGCFGLLYLNPPYDSEDGERVEMKFLKHASKWLTPKGVLVFIVPEHILKPDILEWIGQHYYKVRVYRLHRSDFPAFKQVVMFGYKRTSRAEVSSNNEVPLPPPYQHIEDVSPLTDKYTIPKTKGPELFQIKESVTEEDIEKNKNNLLSELEKIRGKADTLNQLSPLLPLRKGHLVTLLTAGALDGRIDTPDGALIIRGFTERTQYTREEDDDKEIVVSTYSICIRVIDTRGGVPRWYDIR